MMLNHMRDACRPRPLHDIDTSGSNSSDEIKFFTDGQNAMFINSQQQIGMGTQNPEAGQKLQVFDLS